MFCPSCGIEDTIGLPYCNRCGANLGSASLPVNEIAPISVTKPILIIGVVMLFLTLGGFAGVLSSAIELATRAGGGDLSMAVVFFGMITILTIDILLFRLLSKLINAALSSPKVPPKKQTIQAQEQLRFGRPNTARLEPAPSVTEHTTRFFEPVYRSPAEISDPSREEFKK
jgi:Na+-transporting methylmalonyl-CoA/oxaloacetate decarboxylase gamma subunit